MNGSDADGVPHPFNISTGLITGCASCGKHESLSRCSACKVVSYCSREHQVVDRASHKSFCSKIKKAQVRLDIEEAKLRSHPGSFTMEANPFETAVGHFWGLHETRDYMRARFDVVDAQLRINTVKAVQGALEHILDMLRLCRGDNMGVRDLAPALYLRLGRDQECYDFCKWWESTRHGSGFDWVDTSLPYLDTRDADVFEPVDLFTNKFPLISHLLPITLLKIRLLIDLQTLSRARREAGPQASTEIQNILAQHTVGSIIRNNRTILEREDHGPQIKKLEVQIRQLHGATNKANEHVWPALLRPDNYLRMRPAFSMRGSVSEMQIQLQYSYNAWAETEGAIKVVEEIEKS